MDIKRTPKWIRVLKKLLIGFAVLTVVGATGGFVVQKQRDAGVRLTHPAPGTFVEVEGRRIHFRLIGTGEVTFVLEAGLGDYSGSWAGLDAGLAEIGQVLVYDRAGLGWSEEVPQPRTAGRVVTELHRVLEEARVRKPVILVGHSLGGLTQTLYAMRYPDEVAGLLLIDPAHKDQIRRMPQPPAAMLFLFNQLARLAPFGLPQFVMRSSDPMQNQTSHVRASAAEMRAVFTLPETWEAGPITLGDLPIYVFTGSETARRPGRPAAENEATWEIWRSLHAELVAASTSAVRRHEIVKGAGHVVHKTHRTAVVEAAKEMVERMGVGAVQR